jgi:uncharacterized protein YjiS (DUF1127 family)
MNLLKQIAAFFIEYRDFRNTFSELSVLSDRSLEDIGVQRSDIVRVALSHAERRAETYLTGSLSHKGGRGHGGLALGAGR